MNKQAELRQAIINAAAFNTKHISTYEPEMKNLIISIDELVEQMTKLFTTHQKQLLEELLRELPEKEQRPESGAKRNGTAQAVRKARNQALDQVSALIEKKLKEVRDDS